MGGGCYLDCPELPGGDDDDDDDDAGPTNTPGGPSPTSGPTPTTAPPVNLSAVARLVTAADTSCTAIHAATTGVSGTIFGFTDNPPSPQTQAGDAAVSWTNQASGGYTLVI